jgi:hypothetical protein
LCTVLEVNGETSVRCAVSTLCMHGVWFVLLLFHCQNTLSGIVYPPSDSDPEPVGVGGQVIQSRS